MKTEKYPATKESPDVIRCDDGRVRVKVVGVITLKDPDGNKDYHTFWCYRIPMKSADKKAARKFYAGKYPQITL